MSRKLIYITRREYFSASHILENNKLNKKVNKNLFGQCNDIHGHNYYIEVTVCGEQNPESGYVIDLKIVKKIIREEILNKVDHKLLNDLKIFKNIIPTAENIAMKFWEILEPKFKTKKTRLYSVKIYETEKNIAEFRG
jgi:6-pyruvoyltetrahydropterin/6-carboxytetrahydropterin synthase